MSTIGFYDENLISGDDEGRREARAAHRRQQRLALAMRSNWPELPRKDLAFNRFTVTDTSTRIEYRIHRGEVDAVYAPVAAYYIDEAGDPVFLERQGGG